MVTLKMLRFRALLNSYTAKCLYSNLVTSRNTLEPLNRSLIRVSGQEVLEYLQGLITNDMNHLSKVKTGCIYAMFLNTKGRTLYDTILYKFDDSKTYYIECQNEALEPLQRHLKLYRVRKKIDVDSVADEYNIYSLISKDCLEDIQRPEANLENLGCFNDPRVKELGYRVVSKANIDVRREIGEKLNILSASESVGSYIKLRYELGIGEGIEDHPVGTSFPLECNCDYLHGVSFHKGCYIGQELTARVHHTGIVRKRLMPLNFKQIPKTLPKEGNIMHGKVNLGKIRGVEENVGLALLRVDEALELGEIPIGDGIAITSKPKWWPIDVAKVKITSQKST